MKQKIVIKVSMNDDKCRSKALKIAVGACGVESAALIGQEKDQVEVVGYRIDSVGLTRRLRKKVACAELVSVGEAKKEEKKHDSPAALPMVCFPPPPPPYCGHPHYYPCYEVGEPVCAPSCAIM